MIDYTLKLIESKTKDGFEISLYNLGGVKRRKIGGRKG